MCTLAKPFKYRSLVGRFPCYMDEIKEHHHFDRCDCHHHDDDHHHHYHHLHHHQHHQHHQHHHDVLSVCSVDLLKGKKDENRKEHRTNRYHSDNLIVRRGQCFHMWIELSRGFNHCDHLFLQLKLGPIPLLSRCTLVNVPLVKEFKGKCWEAKIIKQECNKIKLSVMSPPNAPIGRYELSVVTVTPRGNVIFKRKPENDIFLLFNPWCKDDAVYLANEDERQEYVLNDVGKIFYGTECQIATRTWNYGQFADGVLAACLFILEKSHSPAAGWGDPIVLTRVVSAMVNAPDDSGVVQGNWSNCYMDGIAPSAWSGSVDILKQYHKTGGTPVKYGQCMVFAGVTNTILRCLGIPTRCITNFNSAHDTDKSITTDVYLTEKLEPIDELNTDTIWNYHVWNESWMARCDLPSGMGGWQVVDATPQETSQGLFRCGPTPVAAIRDGLVYLKYDAPFVFAEVNSDRIFWQRQPNGCFAPIFCEKNIVGRCISTKAVGSDCREDITHHYKHPEGSEEERLAVETASRYGSKPFLYQRPVASDVTFQVAVKDKGLWIGEEAELIVTMKNCSGDKRTASFHWRVGAMFYTGVQKCVVKKEDVTVNLKPWQVHTLDLKLPYDLYREQLVDHASLLFTMAGQVVESKQVLATRFNFRLCTPDIVITPVGEAVIGREMAIKITFRNPLPCILRNVRFRIEGLGLLNTKVITYGDLESLLTITVTHRFIPTLCGQRKLLASLDCQQLTHVHGCTDIIVKEL